MSAAPWLHPGGGKCARILTHPYSGATPGWAYTATIGTLRHEHRTHVQKYGSSPTHVQTHYTYRGIKRHTHTGVNTHTHSITHGYKHMDTQAHTLRSTNTHMYTHSDTQTYLGI